MYGDVYSCTYYKNALFSPTAADSPTDISAVLVNFTSIRVSWTSAASVTGYQVYWSGGGGADTGNMSIGADDTAVTITDLTPGLTYNITLVGLSDQLPSPIATVTITIISESNIICNCGVPDLEMSVVTKFSNQLLWLHFRYDKERIP